jgi:hypothetical protein
LLVGLQRVGVVVVGGERDAPDKQREELGLGANVELAIDVLAVDLDVPSVVLRRSAVRAAE